MIKNDYVDGGHSEYAKQPYECAQEMANDLRRITEMENNPIHNFLRSVALRIEKTEQSICKEAFAIRKKEKLG